MNKFTKEVLIGLIILCLLSLFIGYKIGETRVLLTQEVSQCADGYSVIYNSQEYIYQ